MKNKQEIFQQVKALELKNIDLISHMKVIIRQMESFTEFSYGDSENVRRLNRLLNEYLDEFIKNESSINFVKWTIEKLEE